MKPGPAISTLAMSALAGNAATRAWANARGLLRAGFGQQHRGIGREITVFAGLGAFDHEIRGGGVGRQGAGAAQGVDALGDQGAELGFQRSSAGNADNAE